MYLIFFISFIVFFFLATGRLFGWGSNKSNQLGLPGKELLNPVELSPDLKVINFICGPQSTLIQTVTNQFFLSGHLNDFHFSTFTELNFNFPQQENIIFLHISQSNEIFFVTEKGNIYRSVESARQQNLLFQGFYDYDSEENGPVVKILKGSSYFVALTRNYKLFTTFSESGHHLKTFREISKFKNLRVFDVAVGDKHVLVMGLPRSIKNFDRNRFFNKSAAVSTPDLNGNLINKKNGTSATDSTDSTNSVDSNDPKAIQGNKSIEINDHVNEDEVNEVKTEIQNNDATINVNENLNNEHDLDALNTTKNEESNAQEISNEISNSQGEDMKDFSEVNGEISSDDKTITEISSENLNDKHIDNEPQPSKSKVEHSNDSTQNGTSEPPLTIQNGGNPVPPNCVDGNVSDTHEQNKIYENDILTSDLSSQQNESPILNGHVQSSNESADSKKSGQSENSVKPKSKDSVDRTTSDLSELSESPNVNDTSQTSMNTPINGTSIDNKNESSPKIENEDQPISKDSTIKEQFNNTSSTTHKPRKGSGRSLKFDENSLKRVKSQDRLVRPNTPYPDGTPQTVKRVQNMIQQSDDMIENTSLNLTDSLENIPEISPNHHQQQETISASRRLKYSDRKEKYDEIVRKVSAKPTVVLNETYLELDDEDEKLEIEIKTNDNLDQTTVNEIRFINNGIDVTDNVKLGGSDFKKSEEIQEEFKENTNDQQNLIEKIQDNYNNTPDDEGSTNAKETVASKNELKLKAMDDDERTTASMNSNKNTTQFDYDTDFKPVKETNRLIEDEDEIQNDPSVKKTTKKKMQRFIDDLKSKGKEISCKGGESIKVEGDSHENYTH